MTRGYKIICFTLEWSGLPELTREQWRHSLQRAVEARPPHISVYDLQVGH